LNYEVGKADQLSDRRANFGNFQFLTKRLFV
jgi:hypothetical protein